MIKKKYLFTYCAIEDFLRMMRGTSEFYLKENPDLEKVLVAALADIKKR